jgi:hypothetical protein
MTRSACLHARPSTCNKCYFPVAACVFKGLFRGIPRSGRLIRVMDQEVRELLFTHNVRFGRPGEIASVQAPVPYIAKLAELRNDESNEVRDASFDPVDAARMVDAMTQDDNVRTALLYLAFDAKEDPLNPLRDPSIDTESSRVVSIDLFFLMLSAGLVHIGWIADVIESAATLALSQGARTIPEEVFMMNAKQMLKPNFFFITLNLLARLIINPGRSISSELFYGVQIFLDGINDGGPDLQLGVTASDAWSAVSAKLHVRDEGSAHFRQILSKMVMHGV